MYSSCDMTPLPREIVAAHSPDSDDAFMFYALATKKVRSPKVTFRQRIHVLCAGHQESPLPQSDLSPYPGGHRIAESQSGRGLVRPLRNFLSRVSVRGR